MKRSVWVLVFLTVAALLLASCSEPEQTTQTTTGAPATTPTATGTTVAPTGTTPPAADKPQYGGTIVASTTTNWQDFDEITGSPITFNHTMRFTNEEMWIGDFSTGPGGTNVNPTGGTRVTTFMTGALAESWNFDAWDAGTLEFTIRKGVHFGLDSSSEASRLVNGRELTAEDVLYSFKAVTTTPTSYIYGAYPVLRKAELSAPDKYTFVIKADPPVSAWFLRVSDFFHVVPHEVVEKYGNMKDWRNSVGSGPWLLKDVVDNSSVTFARNPNYWMKDTGNSGKGNQLPYADGVKFLIIPDTNTVQSAFRTGRIDTYTADYKDGPNFIKALPDIKSYQAPAFGGAGNTSMRSDKAPFNDIRVRKAVFKALDFKAIAEALYGQGARWLAWPIGYNQTYKDAYLDVTDPDCPAEVKDVYTYDPEAAIQLLKEAGYPNGLKVGKVIILNRTDVLDYYQTLQTYWAKVGIDITLDPREQGAWYTILQARNYEAMMWGTGSPITNLHQAACMWGPSSTNPAYIDDPVVNEARTKMMALSVKDDPAADKIHRELMKYVLAQAWNVPMPGGVSYGLWWPWLKQFYGSRGGWGYMNTDNWVTWAWVDQPLKKSMGH
jgi:ABC-type transport system substrate-binding protein